LVAIINGIGGGTVYIERNIVFWVAALIIFGLLLWLLSPILLPFVLGLTIAYLLDPLSRHLTKRGVSQAGAAGIILASFAVVFVLLLLLIVPPLLRQLSGFVAKAPEYAQHLQSLASDPRFPWLKQFVGDNLNSGSISDLMKDAMGYLTGMLGSLWSKGTALISIFSLVIVTPIVAFYLGADWDHMLAATDSLIPVHHRETVHKLIREIDKSIAAYVRGQSAVCLILGSYYAIGLSLAGLNFGFLIGVVSGLISFVPYVGSLTALVVSLAIAIAQFAPNWVHIFIIVGIVLVGQFFEGNILSPKLVGHSVGLHPVWLMFALFAFGYLFGFVGLLLAVPLATAAGVLIRFAVRRYRESPIFTGSDEPV
jgi:predicted PurR-regulated permease PerM